MNTIPFEIIGSEPITLEKGQGDEWVISGFPASEQEDFDKDVLERTGVIKGLDHFFRVGGWIDYDHQYPKTKDPKFLIGTATDRTTDKDGRPIVIGKLFQHKELAKAIYDDMGAGGKYGFSMWGQGVRDPKNPKRITHTLINLLTIAPMPKGYDQTLVKKGFPSGTLHSIAKALDADWELEKGESAEEEGSPVKCEGCGKPLNPVEMVMGKYPVCMNCVGKRHGISVTPVPGGKDGGTVAVKVKKSLTTITKGSWGVWRNKQGLHEVFYNEDKEPTDGYELVSTHNDIDDAKEARKELNADVAAKSKGGQVKKSIGEQLSVAIMEHLEKAGNWTGTSNYGVAGSANRKRAYVLTSSCPECRKTVRTDSLERAGWLFSKDNDSICRNCIKSHAENGDHHAIEDSMRRLEDKGSKLNMNRANRAGARQGALERAYEGKIPDGISASQDDVSKAMVAGDGVTMPGANIGAAALKKQELKGARTCKGCGKGISTTTIDFCPACAKLGKKEVGVTAVEKAILTHPSFLRELSKR